MVSGFIQSVQGHNVAGTFVVHGKVRQPQKLNDPCVSLWIITENNGTIQTRIAAAAWLVNVSAIHTLPVCCFISEPSTDYEGNWRVLI